MVRKSRTSLSALIVFTAQILGAMAIIDREALVKRFNPHRNSTSSTSVTPMQVGNGNFAFGTDITGLQTFLPFATLSSWGWHNISLPTIPGQTSPEDFTGLDWWTHGRLVNYDQPNPAEPAISQWLISNPHRINLGRIGFWSKSRGVNLSESDITQPSQTLDLFSGTISSQFNYRGSQVRVQTLVDPKSDTVAVTITSDLISQGELGIFFDYPYATGINKFEAPFVGDWTSISNHTTTLSSKSPSGAEIRHEMDATVYFTSISWNGPVAMSKSSTAAHRFLLLPKSAKSSSLQFAATFSPRSSPSTSFNAVKASSSAWWKTFWTAGSFIDLVSSTSDPQAIELQRRIILSQYLLAVNEAGQDPPQESGLVNNGWYGKFHMEMYLWHSIHWARWDKRDLLGRSIEVYQRFLPTSIERARDQGYDGARWGKMSDPTGRSAPGEINSLLIWQQPHIFYFAETEYRASEDKNQVLDKWDNLLTQTADFMASFAFFNFSTAVYDLGPPMYPASENTNPNQTTNPTFELAYWHFGLSMAETWKTRQGKQIPTSWTTVKNNLAPLPVSDGVYTLYEGIPNMWTDPKTVSDHPAMTAIFGLLPPTAAPGFDLTTMNASSQKIWSTWNFTTCWGWDFPMLSMNALRLGDTQRAVDFLLDKNFGFDDIGMPIGGINVPTPYFPGAGALMIAAAMFSAGWDGDTGMKWPVEWSAQVEGFQPAL